MNQGTQISVVIGVIVVGSVGLYFYQKHQKEQKLLVQNFQPPNSVNTTFEELANTKASEILSTTLTPLRKNRCGMIDSVNTPTKSGKQYVGISPKSPRPKKGDIVKGDVVRIQNTNSVLDAEYEVLGVWLDKNGKIGAVDINHDYPAQGDGDNAQDKVFNKIKASICY